MKNVLIISGHTNLAASVANKTILETLNERLPEAEIVSRTAEIAPGRHHRIAVPPFLVLRTLHIGTLDGRDFPSRILARKYRRQTQRQETRSLFHNGSTRSIV